MIRDERDRAPNFVIVGDVLRHQPTGLEVEMPAVRSKYSIAKAMGKLKALVEKNS